MLTIKHIDHLRGLVRKDIRWREGMLDRFEPKPGQTEEEAEEVREQIERRLSFDLKVLAELDLLSERARALSLAQASLGE